MKNIIKNTIFAFLLVSLISCEDEKDPIVVANGFELRKDSSVISPNVLMPENNTNQFAKFEWDASNNGPASVSTYSVVIFDHDNDTSLSNPIEYSGTGLVVNSSTRNVTLTVNEFNNLINKLPTFECGEMNIDVRIKSVLGTNPSTSFVQYSNPITIAVTGYSTKLPMLAFVKDGNTPENEQKMAASSFDVKNDYQGYMYLEPGNYKFYQPDACGSYATPTIYGGNSGVLEVGNTANSIVIATAGHYLVKADLTVGNQTYSVKNFTTFGIFGKATRPALDGNQVPMTYDSATKTWKLTVELRNGNKFKFKSNLWTGSIVTPMPTPPLNIQYPPYAPGTSSNSVSILGKTEVAFALTENSVTGSGDITIPGVAADNTRSTYEIINKLIINLNKKG
jgi:starch-binding outer membrane protein SusE/F